MMFANPFARAAAEHVARVLELDPSLFAVAAPPKPELGDFAVGCFPAAKQAKASPAALATRVADAFEPGEHLVSATAAGPFVNFHANRDALYRWLFRATGTGEHNADHDTLIPTEAGAGKTICIDYSSPNISKHLAYHHIRSTVIGHALVELYRAVGYRVIGINHLGDWGTTHGMLIAAFVKWMWKPGEPGEPVTGDALDALGLTIAELNNLYVAWRRAIEAQREELKARGIADDPRLEKLSREWFVKLEDGDPDAVTLWKHFRDVSCREFREVYDVLGISFEEVRGESAYLADMQPVIDMLAERGLVAESDGALVVPSTDESTPPLLLRKQDGSTLYATRDLAAAIYRWRSYRFERSLYVVDRGQGLHFRQLFDALARAGHEWAARCAHVPFGLVRIGGKKTGTRSGNVVLLKDVLAEAIRRAAEIIGNNNPAMSEREVARTAQMVGVGGVVFAGLSSQREKDVDFAWESVLDLTGDSGPYVQYAHARCASVLRKGAWEVSPSVGPSPEADVSRLASDYEWALARKLIDFGEVVTRAADAAEPHHLCRYLLDLCALYSRWYTAGNTDRDLRILTGDAAVATARLTLVAAVEHVLARGLGLLGIAAPQAM